VGSAPVSLKPLLGLGVIGVGSAVQAQSADGTSSTSRYPKGTKNNTARVGRRRDRYRSVRAGGNLKGQGMLIFPSGWWDLRLWLF
jgi:hypothetical protein